MIGINIIFRNIIFSFLVNNFFYNIVLSKIVANRHSLLKTEKSVIILTCYYPQSIFCAVMKQYKTIAKFNLLYMKKQETEIQSQIFLPQISSVIKGE